MYLKATYHFILIVIVALLDVAFSGRLPFGINQIHFFPIVLIFVFLLGNIRYAGWWVLGGAYFLELFSFGIYGFHFLGLALSLSAIYILFERVMTNRSLYSIAAVSTVSIILYNTALFFSDYIESNQNTIDWSTLLANQTVAIVYSIITAIVLFYLINAVTKRLRPVFLAQRGYRI